MSWADREADRRARQPAGTFNKVGKSAYVAETERLKAEHDRQGLPGKPPAWLERWRELNYGRRDA